jgi:hypothetical protein
MPFVILKSINLIHDISNDSCVLFHNGIVGKRPNGTTFQIMLKAASILIRKRLWLLWTTFRASSTWIAARSKEGRPHIENPQFRQSVPSVFHPAGFFIEAGRQTDLAIALRNLRVPQLKPGTLP